MLRVFTAFSGYDSQCLALRSIGVDYDLIGWSEIDKYAIQAHNALFPQWSERNYGDISKIDWSQVPDFDLFTYSSPCQDFSQAGKQAGAAKGSGTRSSLLWECERAIEAKRPKYLLFENVAAVVSKKFIGLFREWQLTLERLGYTNFTQVLNAKTHGYPEPVAHNRKRLFMVSILNCKEPYIFPHAQELKTRLCDYLEPEVDKKYYLSETRLRGLLASTEREKERGNGFAFHLKTPNDIANTINAKAGTRKVDNYIMRNKVLGWSRDAKGKVINWHVVVANSITANKRNNTQNYVYDEKGGISRLTPRECFRLMGVSEPDIDTLLNAGISNSQLYKLAGNSIVVNCLASILRQLLIDNFNKHNNELELF